MRQKTSADITSVAKRDGLSQPAQSGGGGGAMAAFLLLGGGVFGFMMYRNN